jgi:NhaP-type Na+/H+ or K+/H+ antiporter
MLSCNDLDFTVVIVVGLFRYNDAVRMRHDTVGKEFMLLLLLVSFVIGFPRIKCMRWMPPSVFAVILGMTVSLVGGKSVSFATEMFLYLGLPTILFHSSLKFKLSSLKKTWLSSVLLSWFVTLFSVLLIAWGILVWTRDSPNAMSPVESLLFASVLAPTDTVAILSLIGQLGADPSISEDSKKVLLVLENESVMNDAICIVLVRLWSSMLESHQQLDRWVPMEVLALTIFYSVVAVLVGVLGSKLMNRIGTEDMTIHYVMALMIYAFCECIDISGILGLFVYGSLLNCPETVSKSVGSIALIIESSVYLLLGLSLHTYDTSYIGQSLLVLMSCISARIIVVFAIGSLLIVCGRKYWSVRSLLFFSLCGVRGAISFALSQNLDQLFAKSSTYVIIITTMLCLGSLQKCMFTLLLTNKDLVSTIV